MKHDSFDSWLKNKANINQPEFDSELEWQLLEPKLPGKKKDRRYIILFVFLGLLGLAYLINHFTRPEFGISMTRKGDKKEQINEVQSSVVTYNENLIQNSKLNVKNSDDFKFLRESGKVIKHSNEIETASSDKKFLSAKTKSLQSENLNITADKNVNLIANSVLNVMANSNEDKISNSDSNFLSQSEELERLRNGMQLLFIAIKDATLSQPRLKICLNKKPITTELFFQTSYGFLNQSLSGSQELAQRRSNSEKGLDLVQLVGGVQARYKNKYFMRTGIELGISVIQFRHQFYDTTIIHSSPETLSVTLNEDLSLSYEIGQATKEQVSLINRKKYNHRYQLSFPILIGFRSILGPRISINYNGGVIIPIYQSFEGEILKHNRSQSIKYGLGVKNLFGPCSIQGGFEVVYHVIKGIHIYSGLNYRAESKYWFDTQTSTKEKHSSWFLSAGMTYALNN
ncbi:MAG: hypothetical protein HOP11_04060 [Saprospiraceae bacterium]|nr:hypothetical protein [Saprospiraceae bacterium]